MSLLEIVKSNHLNVYNQLIARVKMRDNILIVYLAAIGAIFGVALGSNTKSPEILLIIPFLALGTTILFSHHNVLIGSILNFFSNEMDVFYKENFKDQYIPQYETSNSFKRVFESALYLTTWGSFIVTLVPCVISLAFNWKHALGSSQAMQIAWWVAVSSVVVVIVIMIYVHKLRTIFSKNYKEKSVIKYRS